MKSAKLVAIAVSLAVFLVAVAAKPGGFRLVHQIRLGDQGGWDALAVEPATQRLFVTHGTHVQVLDVKSDSVVGDIPNTPGAHGVSLAPELGRGFVSDGRDSTVTVFDLTSLAVVTRIKLAARNPDAIEYDPASNRVFAFNGGSDNATAIDAGTDSIVGSVSLPGRPEFAAADGKGRMYVNLEDSSAVVRFDTRTLQVLDRWRLDPGQGPTGLALDREQRRLFSGCGNQKLVVLDADDGRVVSVLPIGKNVDGVAFDPGRRLVFSSNGEGTLTVIREETPDRFVVVENAATQRGARTLALDPTTGAVYLPTADFGPPPPPTAERPHPWPSIVPGSFRVLVMKR